MSILDHVVYANPQKKAVTVQDRLQEKKRVLPAITEKSAEVPVSEVAKIPGEKEQLKAMKAEFRQKMRSVNPSLTNKQISNTFGSSVKA